ncbi:MAG: phosphoribosylaminoimidazolesuccinocarboxamide synthase [Planctomycetota bacterium]|nr:MAG: phosphoribosylaminoimidazolesuccinocarboxamide synthase [Planctomycetota bacterium]
MSLPATPLLEISVPGLKQLHHGKVREIFAAGDDLLLVASDRVSAFDLVMNEGMAGRGIVLTQLSRFWFERTAEIVPNHIISLDADSWDDVPSEAKGLLRGRSMRCKKAERLPVEWIVRGYLTGSGWKDYQREGVVSGVELPPGLEHAAQFDPPILTASTKADEGHDEPISFSQVEDLVGKELAAKARDVSLALYQHGHDFAREHGFVIADTKFEFGLVDGELTLIDEVLTPDSSRFWPADQVKPGAQPESYDKQVLRDWLSEQAWDKTPPPPSIPSEVLTRAMDRYLHIYESLTSEKLA